MSSTAVYLTIWHITIHKVNFFQKSLISKILLFIFIFGVAIMIIFSRLVLGAHSINQVLYGGLLGIAVYLVHFYVFQLHKIEARNFFEIFRSKKKRIIFTLFYTFLVLFSILIYFIVPNTTIIEEYSHYLNRVCDKVEDFKKFNEDGIFNAFGIFALIGSHLGLIFVSEWLERNNLFDKYELVFNWNKVNTMKKKGLIILFFFIFIYSNLY